MSRSPASIEGKWKPKSRPKPSASGIHSALPSQKSVSDGPERRRKNSFVVSIGMVATIWPPVHPAATVALVQAVGGTRSVVFSRIALVPKFDQARTSALLSRLIASKGGGPANGGPTVSLAGSLTTEPKLLLVTTE